MKAKALSILLAFVCSASNFAQHEGQLLLRNINIIAPTGEMYNVPIWIDMDGDGAYDPGEGIGAYAAAIGAPATMALYLRDDPTPLATAIFRSDIHGAFLGSPAIQSVSVRGYVAGQSAPLTIKVWIGESFEAASIRDSWNFISPPLGGLPMDGGVPIVPTMLYTWGPSDGSGFSLQAPAAPIVATDRLTRRTLSDARTSTASLLANDSDPNGGGIFFVGADAKSERGATVVVTQQGEVIYSPGNLAVTDVFYYTIRNSAGGVSRGRVDVLIDDPEGLIVFETRNIPRLDGNGTYNVPLYVDANLNGAENMGEAFGSFAETYYAQKGKLGLFLTGSNDPLAVMEIAPPEVGVFTEVPGAPLRIVAIPGVAPGFAADLTIKAWIGDTFEDSRVKGAWNFTSLVLGGTVANGASFPIPGLTGWGPETGQGLALSPGPVPTLGADEIVRGYRQDATITIETLLANDIDPDGGALVFLDFDRTTTNGATIKRSDSTLTYHSPSAGADHFFYTVRSARGVIAKGRVNVNSGEPVGEILLANSETPIWVDLDADGVRDQHEGVGHYASLISQSAQAAFHIQGQTEPFAVTHFNSYPIGSDGAFLTAPNNTTLVPGFKPGERAPLTVKVWVGNSFEDATVKGSWHFVSLPLGGPINSSDAVVAPTLAGWGNENGLGYALAADTNVVLPPIVIPIRIYDPVRIWYHVLVPTLPIGDSGTGLFLPEFTTGGNAIIRFTNNALVEATLFHNDSFAYSVATPTGMTVGVVGLQVQESPAKIFLSNRLIRRANGPGGYNVPVWVDLNFNGARDRGEGIGSFAAREFSADATLGLFLRDATTPIATARFHRDAAGSFLDDPDFQEVVIPNASPGAQVPLTLKAWIGDSFATATIKSSWHFTSKQLGGAALAGVFETPDVTGWGDETTSRGYAIMPGAKPKTYGTVITRQPGQNVNVKIADMIKNDSDPDGGALTFVSVDDSAKEGGVISLLGDTAYYVPPLNDSGAPDYFEYTVRNSKGGIAKGRVDVVVTDSQGQFNTRLAIQHTATGNEITFRGVIGANYLIQFRDTIEAAWQDLGPAVHDAFGLLRIIDETAAETRFYRVVTEP
jgi:hypothetical protein